MICACEPLPQVTRILWTTFEHCACGRPLWQSQSTARQSIRLPMLDAAASRRVTRTHWLGAPSAALAAGLPHTPIAVLLRSSQATTLLICSYLQRVPCVVARAVSPTHIQGHARPAGRQQAEQRRTASGAPGRHLLGRGTWAPPDCGPRRAVRSISREDLTRLAQCGWFEQCRLHRGPTQGGGGGNGKQTSKHAQRAGVTGPRPGSGPRGTRTEEQARSAAAGAARPTETARV